MRIRLEIQPKYMHRFFAMMQAAPALEAQGIILAPDLEDPDVVFIQESTIREQPHFTGQFIDRPLIVYERIGCAPVNIKTSVRRFLQRRNVVAWAKETDYYDLTLNNVPMIDGRYHLTLINGGPHAQTPASPTVQLSPEDLGKICHIFPIHLQERYHHLRTVRTKTLRKRPIDVLFAGTMNYASKLVDDHRLNLVRRLVELPYDVVAVRGTAFSQGDFQDLLTKSKIFVSPYGSGAYSWKDFEAIFAGCVLIKPKADFIAHYGFPIYEPGRFCISCDPSFSDLPQLINAIMSDIEGYSAFAADAQTALLKACSPDEYAFDLGQFFNGVV